MDNIEAKEVKQAVEPATETPPQTEAKVNTEAPPELINSDGISFTQNTEMETNVNREGVQHSEERRVASDETPVRDPSEEGETALTGLSDNACVAGRPKSRLDVEAEWKELADAHPELVGNQLPDDIMQACLNSTLPPIRVYESMMIVKQAAEIKALQEEIATLRQNAEAAAKAPVRATTPGGKTDTEAEDAFIRAFKAY